MFIFLPNSVAQNNSVLSSGDWFKVSTKKEGIYKLDYSDLANLGINVSNLQIKYLKLYGNGGGMLPKLNSAFRYSDLTENAIVVHDYNDNGILDNEDYILFYGMSSSVWKFDESTNSFDYETHLYADEVSYFINIDNDSDGKRVAESSLIENPTKTITSFRAFAHHELELKNLLKSGSKWFGEQFLFDNKKTISFSFPNLRNSEFINIKLAAAARSFQTSSFKIEMNSSLLTNIFVTPVPNDYAKQYANEVLTTNQFLSNSSNLTLDIEYSSDDDGAEAWLDYVHIDAIRDLKLSGDYINFSNVESISNELAQYVIEDGQGLEVWDVTDPTNISKLPVVINEGALSFNDSLNTLHKYFAFNSFSYLNPVIYGLVENQNIHNTNLNTDFIIVCHPNFLSAANRLANFHLNQDNLITTVVTPQQIYNEFSSGMQDVSAIRDFIKYQYYKQESQLKYLLLFGDGSYDPKNRIENNTNYIPTYQSLNSTHPVYSYVTDDFFGLLNESEGLFTNDLVDLGIGRFPVSTLLEANILVDKVENYYQVLSFGNWRNDVTFVADDGDALDGNTHMWQADSLANHLADNYRDVNIQKIYLDNYYQESTSGGPRSPDAQSAISNSVKKGAILVNYTGHGGPLGWTQERILEIDQIKSWNNLYKLPLFMTATCKFSCFDNPDEKSAGEHLLLNDNGGAIALLSTTRLVYSFPNYNLNTKFIQTIFEKQSGQFPRLGDLFKTTKVLSGTSSNNRNFTLLGNPALRLSYPDYEVITTNFPDTMKALSEVYIEGNIQDDGLILSDFNGVIYSTVYDKEVIKNTLGQESCTQMPYRDQNNVLYKGMASVKNGQFSFSFIVPKDIAYNYGMGKISFYAVNDEEENPIDANGAEENFIIGGTADDIIYDYDEAEISLFMNDTLFLDGGLTDENPILLAYLFDRSGINTVGNGIGHDITAILDGNTSNPYILNNFYESSKDDFTRGVIRFPLYNLAEGVHYITLKVWDVFNNSSDATISFVVSESSDLTISEFTASPNPFSVSTNIYFQHNKVNQDLNYILDIYSLSGFLVKRFERSSFNSLGYRIGPIIWDGNDDYGGQMSPGMYLAKISVTSEDGDFSSKSIRIILLN
jgi:hypothetical protein